jgi:GDPmannose 4,6-dehydratase
MKDLKKKRVLITGIAGQDGSYMAELCLSLGLEVHGFVRNVSSPNLFRLQRIIQDPALNPGFHLYFGDILEFKFVNSLMQNIQPDFVFNFAAQSHVLRSFELPEMTFQTNNLGLLHIISSTEFSGKQVKIYQASSSELFGNSAAPQGFDTVFDPQSPYAIAKLSAHFMSKLYKMRDNLDIRSGILFNHESYRRGDDFVTKKIVLSAARISKQIKNGFASQDIKKLPLGNLDARRDWGWAPEYMLGVLSSTVSDENCELIIGTGKSASVREFASRAFANFDLDFEEWTEHDSSFERPSEVHFLEANVDDVRRSLGWVPKFGWQNVCDLMCEEELASREENINWKELATERNLLYEF